MNNLNNLISRTETLDTIFGCFNVMESRGIDMTVARMIVKGALNTLPAVNITPVVHAQWRELKDGSEECTNCLGLCPHEENYNGDIVFNFDCEYCPWCGAKMDS